MIVSKENEAVVVLPETRHAVAHSETLEIDAGGLAGHDLLRQGGHVDAPVALASHVEVILLKLRELQTQSRTYDIA